MITLTPTNLIAVEVPKEANDFKLFFEFGHTRISYNEKSESEIPIMNYTFQNLFLNSEIDIEILGEVTDTEMSFDTYPHIEKDYFDDYGYDEMITIERMWDYEEKSFSLESSENSFRSLLRYNGIVIREGYKYIILIPTNQN